MPYTIVDTCMLVPGVSQANCAGWVQAWGSILGLAIAIWIPLALRQQEIRQKRRTERAAAIVIADSVLHILQPLIAVLDALSKDLTEERTAVYGSSVRTNVGAVFKNFKTPTENQLLILAASQPDTAQVLSRGLTLLSQIELLFQMSSIEDIKDAEFEKAHWAQFRVLHSKSLLNLQLAYDQLMALSSEN